MALTRRNFLLFAANDAHVYEGPGKRTMSEVGAPEDASSEKTVAPLPVGTRSVGDFLRRCVGCLKCIDACPRRLLRPSSRLDRLGRPEIVFRLGWCRPECGRCAAACPAGALGAPTATAEDRKSSHAGLARWIPERCVAATGKDVCHACERHCPTQAITLVRDPKAAENAPSVPRVDAAKCIGCGACEYYCPARPKTAMIVEGRI